MTHAMPTDRSESVFPLTEEHEAFRRTVADFAQREIAPDVAAYDREERFPDWIVRKAAALGLTGGVIPVEHGGAGMDHLSYAIMIEELAKVCNAAAAAVGVPSGLVGKAVLNFGTPEQIKQFLSPLARGESFGAAGITEPQSGSDVAGLETTYRQDGGDFVLQGSKTWISFITHCHWLLTFATRDRSLRHAGITAFIIPRDTPGLSFHPFKNKLGFRPLATGEVSLEGVRIPREYVLGEEGQGFEVAMTAVENGRLTDAARALGIAQGSLDLSCEYARQREVFGREIAEYQLIQSLITDMVVGVEATRYFVYRLALLKDRGLRARREASLAKMHATDVALNAATAGIQIHGAYGVSDELPLHRYFRDAKVLQIVEGTNQIHRIMVAQYALGLRSDEQ